MPCQNFKETLEDKSPTDRPERKIKEQRAKIYCPRLFLLYLNKAFLSMVVGQGRTYVRSMQEIKTVNIGDKNYPQRLREILNPPKILYYQGELAVEQELCFAVVGARMCSAYGRQAVLEIAGDLAEAGLTVVSGLAPGIDTFCHQAVLERGKRTIAVLGTGIDEKSLYPKQNLKLAKEIIDRGGCLMSEYPAGTPGAKFTFPRRNRIVSGLCLGVLVIEAKQKSGALITADFAFKQKRKVFALPGSIYSSNSRGCHRLIKRGAKLAESADDILTELNLPLRSRPDLEHFIGASREENLILGALKQESLDIDGIIEGAGLPPAVVAANLTVLEIRGMVRNLGGNVFALKRSS